MKKEEVVLYAEPACVLCDKVKGFLRQNGIPFREYDISVSDEAREEMEKISGQKYPPVIVKKDKVVIGFDWKRLNELFF